MTQEAAKRVQYLQTVINGVKFTGVMTEQMLIMSFLNKQVALKVTGRAADNGKGYPDLGYAGFAMNVTDFKANPSKLDFSSSERGEINDALEAIKSSRSTNADKEAGAGAPSATAGSTAKVF